MQIPGLQHRRSIAMAAGLLVVAALLWAPVGIGFSTGIHSDMSAAPPDFAAQGCTNCHGGGSDAPHDFGPHGSGVVSVQIADGDGRLLTGPYAHETEYTITITLEEQREPGAANHAGFNLRLSEGAGELAAVDGSSQVSDSGLEATHVNAASTSWQVLWTAPAEGPVVFDLWVNDVDGSGAPDAGDDVYNVIFGLPDLHNNERAIPGAVEEHEPHVGVPLPQYWLGLIALAGMIFIMLFAFVYLKYVSPHNADKGDR